MREIVARYKISEELCLYIERVFYVVEGLKALLLSFTAHTDFPVHPRKMQTLRQEYLEAYAELSVVLRKVYNTEVDLRYLDATQYTQEVNFEFSEILIYEVKGCAIKKSDT